MFLNPNRVGPFFAAATGFVYHIISYYRGLQNQLKRSKIKVKEMMQDFRDKLQGELREKAANITDQIEQEAKKIEGQMKNRVVGDVKAGLNSVGLSQRGSAAALKSSAILPEFFLQNGSL